jgi:integrase
VSGLSAIANSDIPLNKEAMAAILELYKRAQAVEATDLNHYVFPACENDKIDPKRPQTTWRTAWRKLTSAVQCPACGLLQSPADKCSGHKCDADIHELKSPLAGLRFHDLRHHAITELGESQASDQTVMAIAGHVSAKMLAHYSHVRIDAKRHALDALSSGGITGVMAQTTAQMPLRRRNQVRKLLRDMVGPCGLEPQTSTVSNLRYKR